ncbi:MAG: 2-amino-4-hydroxy-6-hydroxymethyldihydropteridine diphosphokinase [Actinomycetota bacterium]|nr:2-amino-4-hydroxy-6-hydroxymethyldihydropteridine diphosphokinase [Actinomycetota bacterium]
MTPVPAPDRPVAYIGLGSNLGDRLRYLRRAVAALAALEGVEVLSASSVYESEPVGPEQPDYLNAVVRAAVTLGPERLLAAMHRIEGHLGRTREMRWGPRTIDLDLLLYGDRTIETNDLKVPHPELTKRSFVLVPLLEIDPYLELPSGEPLLAYCQPHPAGIRLHAPPNDLAGTLREEA